METKIKKYLDIKEASSMTTFARDTLYHWASSKPPRIPHFKIGKRIMFSVDDLEHFMQAHRRSA